MTTRSATGIAIATLLLMLAPSNVYGQLKPMAIIVAQAGAPVSITTYGAQYFRRSEYRSEGIHHSVKFQNVSDKDVVAVQFGLVSFDVWNQFLNRSFGLTTLLAQPKKAESGQWVANVFGDFSFLTGVAYVSKVRFSDGSIWEAPVDDVLEELRKIEKDFDANRLKRIEPKTEG